MGAGIRLVVVTIRRVVRALSTPHEVVRTLRSTDIATGFPRYTRWLKGLVTLELVFLAAVAVWKPVLLLPIAVLVGAGAAWFAWQARPGRGAAKGWPPGSVGTDSRAMADPDYLFKEWNRHGPVFKGNLFDQPVVYVAGLDNIIELFHEHGDALAPNTFAPWNRFIPGGLARWTSGETHDRYRRLLGGSLGARLISNNRDAMKREIERTLVAMAAESTARGRVAPEPFVEDLVFATWAQIFFGISRTDGRFVDLERDFDTISVEKQRPGREVRPAIERLVELVTSKFNDAIASGDPGHVNETLLGEMTVRDPETIDDEVSIINLIYLMETTSLDVAGLLMWVLKHAADNPRYLEQLRENVDETGPLALANRMISETVRLEQSEYLHRFATADIAFQCMTIPKGWMVHACIHESHRDPRLFADPDGYDPDRFLHHPKPTEYAPFGVDGRACVGVPLTREIGRSFLTGLAGGYDLHTIRDGPRELSVQRHWAPSSQLRLALVARGAAPARPTRVGDNA